MTLILLTAMLFCHIIDDYVLQGWLATGKQKEWWKINAPEWLTMIKKLKQLFCKHK